MNGAEVEFLTSSEPQHSVLADDLSLMPCPTPQEPQPRPRAELAQVKELLEQQLELYQALVEGQEGA